MIQTIKHFISGKRYTKRVDTFKYLPLLLFCSAAHDDVQLCIVNLFLQVCI